MSPVEIFFSYAHEDEALMDAVRRQLIVFERKGLLIKRYDREIVEAYLRELGTKLKISGKGFIHHSNFGEYADSLRERIPEALAKPLIKAKILDWAHHRNPSMSAELFRVLCEQHGLHCISQELVNWRGRRLIDCLSLFERSDSALQNATKVVRNPNFMREAARIRRQSRKRS